jgi:hypothetical protein
MTDMIYQLEVIEICSVTKELTEDFLIKNVYMSFAGSDLLGVLQQPRCFQSNLKLPTLLTSQYT